MSGCRSSGFRLAFGGIAPLDLTRTVVQLVADPHAREDAGCGGAVAVDVRAALVHVHPLHVRADGALQARNHVVAEQSATQLLGAWTDEHNLDRAAVER